MTASRTDGYAKPAESEIVRPDTDSLGGQLQLLYLTIALELLGLWFLKSQPMLGNVMLVASLFTLVPTTRSISQKQFAAGILLCISVSIVAVVMRNLLLGAYLLLAAIGSWLYRTIWRRKNQPS